MFLWWIDPDCNLQFKFKQNNNDNNKTRTILRLVDHFWWIIVNVWVVFLTMKQNKSVARQSAADSEFNRLSHIIINIKHIIINISSNPQLENKSI